jgi:hypothetical protein
MCNFASWMAIIFWYLQGGLTIVIALLALYIAYQQWRTNALKSKLDLFGRRCQVLDEVRKLLSLAYGKGDLTADELREFMSQMLPAEFLFGPEIKEYIGDIYSHGWSLSTANEQRRGIFEGASGMNREEVVNKTQAEIKWLIKQLPITADKFRNYLDVSKL